MMCDVFALLSFACFLGVQQNTLYRFIPHGLNTGSFTLKRLKDEDVVGAISHASGLPAFATTSISPAINREVDASDL